MRANGDGNAEQILLESTGRSRVGDAIAWIAEGHPLAAGVNSRLLRALVQLDGGGDIHNAALRRVVREVCQSDIDTAKVVFDAENLPDPIDFRRALDELLSRTPNQKFEELTPRAVLRAQYGNSRSIEALCLAVGVSYTDACDWFSVGTGGWTLGQVTDLLGYLNRLVKNEVPSPIANSVPARALELIFGNQTNWLTLDDLRANGVPYELLLAQRAAGGVWLAHKNKTSSFPNIAAADLLCSKLGEHGIEFRRASTIGGSSRQRDLQTLSGIPKKQVGVVVMKADIPSFAVAFSSARDGGTARANGDGLLQIPVTDLPLAFMLTGLGWAVRQETDRLASRFGGLLFTERTVDDLVSVIAESTQ